MSLGPRCLEAQPHPPLAARRQGGSWSPGQAPASWELRSARRGWQRGATLLPTLVSRRAGPPGGVIQRTPAVCSRHRISRIVERNTVERKVRLGHFSFCVSALKAQETGPRVTWGLGSWAHGSFLRQLGLVLLPGPGATGHSPQACPGLALCANARNWTGRAVQEPLLHQRLLPARVVLSFPRHPRHKNQRHFLGAVIPSIIR